MPRPVRKRIIYQKPDCTFFAAEGAETETVQLTLDELEALRLMDEVGLDQTGCAQRMHVGRSTFQNILNGARKKVAGALVHGRNIEIYGGQVEVSDDAELGCCQYALRTLDRVGGISQREEKEMKLAVTYNPENGEIFQHFGRTEEFKVYDVENNEIKASTIVSTNGQGHGALIGVLEELKIDTLICGGIGGGAQMGVASMGIKLYGGVQGKADDAVKALLEGRLEQNSNANCNHHHDEGHNCSHSSCGGHCHH